MQALAVIWLQAGLSGLLVVPWLVGGARLHGRQDAHQPGLIPTLSQELFHPVLFPKVSPVHVLDRDSALGGPPIGVLSPPIPERFGKTRVVENPNLPLVQIGGHPSSETNLRKRPEHHHPVEAGQNSRNL